MIPRLGGSLRLVMALIATAGLALYAGSRFVPPVATNVVVSLPSQAHDFGSLTPLSKSEYTFVGRNDYADVLVIDRIIKSCGCTSARCDQPVVPPGQTFFVKAILTARPVAEDMFSSITIYGHAGQRRVIGEYQLSGVVKDIIEFPGEGGGFLQLGSWSPDRLPAQTSVTVRRGGYPLDFDDLHVACESPILSAQVTKTSHDSWSVRFRINPTDLIGSFGYPATFTFSRQGRFLQQSVPQQSYVEMAGPFVAAPSSLLLTAAPGEHVQESIEIAARNGTSSTSPPNVIRAWSSLKNVKTTSPASACAALVLIDYSAPPRECTDRGEIIVSLFDHGKTYKLRIGLLALVS
jgi:Protein of unknown function (DUF1573)